MTAEERLAKKMELFYKLLGSFYEDAQKGGIEMDSRLFWKINVRAENGCLYCEKELSLWGRIILDGFNLDSGRFVTSKVLTPQKKEINNFIAAGFEELSSHWHRFLHVAVPLQIYAVSNDRNFHDLGISPVYDFNTNLPDKLKGKLWIDNNGINFNGAHLMIVDSGISNQLSALGIPTDNGTPTHSSDAVKAAWKAVDSTKYENDLESDSFPSSTLVKESYVSVGRNIYLEADYAINEPHNINNPTESTVFYFCQLKTDCDSDKFVELKEKVGLQADNTLSENVQSITWSIYEGNDQDGQQKLFLTREPSAALVGHHLVVVNQDQDLLMDKLNAHLQDNGNDSAAQMLEVGLRSRESWTQPYFEILLDTIPLSIEDELTIGTFPFTNGKINFYVGANPNNPDGSQLKGSLKRLVFDPNSSCPSCPA